MAYPYLDTTLFLNLKDLLGSEYDPSFLSFDPENNQDAYLEWLQSYVIDSIVGSSVITSAHEHSNKAILDQITSQGSGEIITDIEREWLHGNETWDGLNVLVNGHVEILKNISSYGSGEIITTAERDAITALSTHLTDTNNPHNVTASQIGANNLVSEINGDIYQFTPNVLPSSVVHDTELTNYWTKSQLINPYENGSVGILDWTNIANIPDIATSNHTHTKSDITDFNHTHTKSDITDFDHNHDDRYYTETEIDNMLSSYSAGAHTHDDRYYTKTQLQTSGSSSVHWDNITNKPVLSDGAWKSPVATINDLPSNGNTDGDIRIVLDEDNVYTWNDALSQWDLVGSNNFASITHNHNVSDINGLDTHISNHTDVYNNTLNRHTHNNKSILDGILDLGSGNIITTTERNRITTAYNHVSDTTSNPHQIGMSDLIDTNANNQIISNVADPVNDQDAATKQYVIQLLNSQTHVIADITDFNTHTHDNRYYTKTELQTSGSSSVHWDNITNIPNMAIEGHTHVITDITDFNTHNHDDRYYTETELQTSGSSSVHWDNITDTPIEYNPSAHSHTYSINGIVQNTSSVGGDISFLTSGLINITNNNSTKTITFSVDPNHTHALTDSNITGKLPINKGGTNNDTFTSNELLIFNGGSIISSGKQITDFADVIHSHPSYVNQNAFGKITINSTDIIADSEVDTLTIVEGNNITLSTDTATDTITIASTNNYLNGLSFNTSNGVLTASINGLSDIDVDLDGRYSLSSHTHSGYENQNAISSISALTTSNSVIGTIDASTTTDTFKLKEGSDIDLQVDIPNKTITINAQPQTKTIKHCITLFKGGSVSSTGYQQPFILSSYTGTITRMRYRCASGSGNIRIYNNSTNIGTVTCDSTWRSTTVTSNITAGSSELKLYCESTGQSDIVVILETNVNY